MPLSDQRKIELISQALTHGDRPTLTTNFTARLFIRESSAVLKLRTLLIDLRDEQSLALANADATSAATKATLTADVTDLNIMIPGV